MSITNRIVRWLSGVILLSWGIAGGPLWTFGGIYLLFTGSWAYCPLEHLLKKSKSQN
ncbi:MAG: DUF2892 domain-containing protein [Bdellovibrionales bacterium]|nr:DUF2892 domain-containing protein [Bdellovibrionales bacterium]